MASGNHSRRKVARMKARLTETQSVWQARIYLFSMFLDTILLKLFRLVGTRLCTLGSTLPRQVQYVANSSDRESDWSSDVTCLSVICQMQILISPCGLVQVAGQIACRAVKFSISLILAALCRHGAVMHTQIFTPWPSLPGAQNEDLESRSCTNCSCAVSLV